MESVSVGGVKGEVLGFGTAWLTGEACQNTVEYALEFCYQYIETA